MFARWPGDRSQAATTSRGLTLPHGPAYRFSARIANRYPARRAEEPKSEPQGVCEKSPHDATTRPLIAEARTSIGDAASLERPLRARAKFRRHVTARIWVSTEAVGSAAPLHAAAGARTPLCTLVPPSAELATTNAASAAANSAASALRAGVIEALVATDQPYERERGPLLPLSGEVGCLTLVNPPLVRVTRRL